MTLEECTKIFESCFMKTLSKGLLAIMLNNLFSKFGDKKPWSYVKKCFKLFLFTLMYKEKYALKLASNFSSKPA